MIYIILLTSTVFSFNALNINTVFKLAFKNILIFIYRVCLYFIFVSFSEVQEIEKYKNSTFVETPKTVKKGKTVQKHKAKQEKNKSSCTKFVEPCISNNADETMASQSNYYGSSHRGSSKVKYKNQGYQTKNYNDYENYSNPYNYNNQFYYDNAKYSYSNNWNSRQYGSMPFQNAPRFNSYVLTSNLNPQYGYNSQNAYYPRTNFHAYNFNTNANKPSSSEVYNENTNETSECHNKRGNSEGNLEEEKLSSKDSENSENLTLNSKINDTSSKQSASPKVTQTKCSNNSSNESVSATNVINNHNKHSLSPVPNINNKNKNERRRRSRSLCSTESNSNENQIKEGIESLSADSDSVAEQQKIKEWANTLLETNPGQISRLIHPSNYKDKAAVNQLITNLAKSKRKENLTKLKSNSVGSNENLEEEENDIISEEIEKIVESVISVSDNKSSNSQFDLPSTESNSEEEHNAECRPKVKRYKKSSTGRNSESDRESVVLNTSGKSKSRKVMWLSVSSDDSCNISNKNNKKSKESHLNCQESIPEQSRSPNSEKSLKRKSQIAKSKSKKQRCSSAEHSENVCNDQSYVQADAVIPTSDTAIITPEVFSVFIFINCFLKKC